MIMLLYHRYTAAVLLNLPPLLLPIKLCDDAHPSMYHGWHVLQQSQYVSCWPRRPQRQHKERRMGLKSRPYSNIPGLLTGHDPARGLKGQDVFYDITGRVGSGRGRFVKNSHGTGRATLSRPNPTRLARFVLIREEACKILRAIS